MPRISFCCKRILTRQRTVRGIETTKVERRVSDGCYDGTIPCPIGKPRMLSFNYFTSSIPRKAEASGIIPLGDLRVILGTRLQAHPFTCLRSNLLIHSLRTILILPHLSEFSNRCLFDQTAYNFWAKACESVHSILAAARYSNALRGILMNYPVSNL